MCNIYAINIKNTLPAYCYIEDIAVQRRLTIKLIYKRSIVIMGKKIFVSYKYHDSNVKALISDGKNTTVRSYVTYIEKNMIGTSDNIYKGEHENEDLSDKSEEYIWSELKDKMYDSSVTIVMISPNMKEPHKWEKSQWIPWEIAYSLRETTRKDRTSHSNAVLAVVLPDSDGSYDYYNDLQLFRILESNIDNEYIPVYKWSYFNYNLDACIDKAFECKKKVSGDLVVKSV